jgi:hypothetical protein
MATARQAARLMTYWATCGCAKSNRSSTRDWPVRPRTVEPANTREAVYDIVERNR